MAETFAAHSDNFNRPWMVIVEEFGFPEERAKELFDRIEPCLSMEKRYQIIVGMVRDVKAMRYWRRG